MPMGDTLQPIRYNLLTKQACLITLINLYQVQTLVYAIRCHACKQVFFHSLHDQRIDSVFDGEVFCEVSIFFLKLERATNTLLN
jgi:hypothetical protein